MLRSVTVRAWMAWAMAGVLVLSLADHMGARGPRLDWSDYARHVAYIAYVLDRMQQMRKAEPPKRLLTGEDLIRELGLAEGPVIGRLLRAVEEAEGAGEIATRDEAMSVARTALAGIEGRLIDTE